MKIVVDSLISKLYESEILKLDPNMEIIVLNPEDHTNPAWGDIPEIDALFLSYQFLFAVRDHKHLFEPMLEVAKKAKFIQSGYSGMDDPFASSLERNERNCCKCKQHIWQTYGQLRFSANVEMEQKN